MTAFMVTDLYCTKTNGMLQCSMHPMQGEETPLRNKVTKTWFGNGLAKNLNANWWATTARLAKAQKERSLSGGPIDERVSEMSLWMILPVSLPALTITGIWVVWVIVLLLSFLFPFPGDLASQCELNPDLDVATKFYDLPWIVLPLQHRQRQMFLFVVVIFQVKWILVFCEFILSIPFSKRPHAISIQYIISINIQYINRHTCNVHIHTFGSSSSLKDLDFHINQGDQSVDTQVPIWIKSSLCIMLISFWSHQHPICKEFEGNT